MKPTGFVSNEILKHNYEEKYNYEDGGNIFQIITAKIKQLQASNSTLYFGLFASGCFYAPNIGS
jgi:hypothetical protein